jgi:hypothetical protein
MTAVHPGPRLRVELPSRPLTPGSERIDRETKPGEYARAGIARFWRVERGDNAEATVHQFRLGNDERGEPTYLGHRALLLEDMLTSKPPELS